MKHRKCTEIIFSILTYESVQYRVNDDTFDEFCYVLSIINSLVESFPNALLILGGDYNVDFARRTSHCGARAVL